MEGQLTMDELAARMADSMLRKGDLPEGRKEAEGGFTAQAGGSLIDDKAEKAAFTGSAITSEPGRQGSAPRSGEEITAEPKRQGGGGAGDGGNLSQTGDASTRKRKAGTVAGGKSSKGAGSKLSEEGDASTRARKGGQVSKADDEEDEDEAEKGCRLGAAEKSDDKDEDDKKKKFPFMKADEGDEGDEEEEEDDDEAEKGGIEPADLIKSLETLEAIAQGATVRAPAQRRSELAQRLEEGTLSKSEMRELSDMLKAAEAPEEEEEFAKSYQEQWAADPVLTEGYEVSQFLERHSQHTAAALDEVQTRLAKSLDDHRERVGAFNTQLAKSLLAMAKQNQRQETLIKSLSDRLSTVESQPLPRRGVSNVRALNKSLSGEADDGRLSRSDILDTLEQMAMKADRAPCGENLMRAVALFENEGSLTKSLYNDVVRFRKTTATAY